MLIATPSVAIVIFARDAPGQCVVRPITLGGVKKTPAVCTRHSTRFVKRVCAVPACGSSQHFPPRIGSEQPSQQRVGSQRDATDGRRTQTVTGTTRLLITIDHPSLV